MACYYFSHGCCFWRFMRLLRQYQTVKVLKNEEFYIFNCNVITRLAWENAPKLQSSTTVSSWSAGGYERESREVIIFFGKDGCDAAWCKGNGTGRVSPGWQDNAPSDLVPTWKRIVAIQSTGEHRVEIVSLGLVERALAVSACSRCKRQQ